MRRGKNNRKTIQILRTNNFKEVKGGWQWFGWAAAGGILYSLMLNGVCGFYFALIIRLLENFRLIKCKKHGKMARQGLLHEFKRTKFQILGFDFISYYII